MIELQSLKWLCQLVHLYEPIHRIMELRHDTCNLWEMSFLHDLPSRLGDVPSRLEPAGVDLDPWDLSDNVSSSQLTINIFPLLPICI